MEKDTHSADSQNLKNSKQSSAKINNIYGVYLFSIQSKNSFIESPGKNVPLTTYIIQFIDWKNGDDKIVSLQSLSADIWVSLRGSCPGDIQVLPPSVPSQASWQHPAHF